MFLVLGVPGSRVAIVGSILSTNPFSTSTTSPSSSKSYTIFNVG